MKHTLSLLVIFGLLQLSNSVAQTAIELTLDEALQLTKEQNIENRLKVLEYEQSKAEKQTSNSLFLPKVSISETGIRTNNPLAVFGFLLQQRQVQSNDFNSDVLNSPGNRANWNTQVLVEQPLINMETT